MINDQDVFAVFSLFSTNKHHFQPIDHFTDNIPIVPADVVSLPKYLKCNINFLNFVVTNYTGELITTNKM